MNDVTKSTVITYLDDGRVFSYECDSRGSREHASEIIKTGYRSSGNGVLEWFPPHRIRKVKVIGGDTTEYTDTVTGT